MSTNSIDSNFKARHDNLSRLAARVGIRLSCLRVSLDKSETNISGFSSQGRLKSSIRDTRSEYSCWHSPVASISSTSLKLICPLCYSYWDSMRMVTSCEEVGAEHRALVINLVCVIEWYTPKRQRKRIRHDHVRCRISSIPCINCRWTYVFTLQLTLERPSIYIRINSIHIRIISFFLFSSDKSKVITDMRADVNSRQNMHYQGSYHHHHRRHVTTDPIFSDIEGLTSLSLQTTYVGHDWQDVQPENDWRKEAVQVASYV